MMEEFQEQNLWFAGLTMDWRFAQRWSLIAQLDSHAAPLDSDITGVGDDAVMASLGTRWRFTQHWSVDISVVEDIRVETAPDVTFQASLRYRPVLN
jgi:long-subunit fatty acid transport protein